MTTYMYSLRCPLTIECRYVGKSDYPQERLADHISEAKRGVKTHKANWIRSLLARGLSPLLEIEDEVPDEEWQIWEKEWIRFYRALGCELVNGTDGGDGGPGHESLSEEHKSKIGKSLEGHEVSEITRGRIRKALLGHEVSDETKEKQSAAKKGKSQPREAVLKRAAANTGKKRTAETRAKQSVAALARRARERAEREKNP